VRQWSTEDYINMIATMTAHVPKPLKWEEGGKGVVQGWAIALKKQQQRKLCQTPSRQAQ
jgi:hypothetical protein